MKNFRKAAYLSLTIFAMCQIGLAEHAKWAGKMQALSSAVSEILPDIMTNKPLTPAAQKRLLRGAKTISDLSHTIKMGTEASPKPLPPDADPSLTMVSGLFERLAKHGYNLIKDGHVDYGRNVLRSLTGYCIACHTRGDQGPDFPTLPLNPRANSLTTIEKGDLFAATRQFDKALAEYEKVIGDAKFATVNQVDWGRAVRRGLMIAVRVKKDPAKAQEVIAKASSLSTIPAFYAKNIASWKKSVDEWKGASVKPDASEEELFALATKQMEKAKSLQKYPMDHSADVEYLNVTAMLHDLLIKYPHGKRSSEGLMMLGDAYSVLDEPSLTTLPEMYFESCIRAQPHTKVAQACYLRFEESVYFGYSGSGGTSIPADVNKVMSELRALAN